MSEQESAVVYKVVMNHEEQYSIWPADRENALGWRDAGFTGPKAESLAYIKEHWTDMRPLSLRQQMAGSQPTASNATVEAKSNDLGGMTSTPVATAPVVMPSEPVVAASQAPAVPAASEAQPKRGFFSRLFGRGKKAR